MGSTTETVVRGTSHMAHQVGQRMQGWRRPLVWIRRHGIALAIVLLACAIGQVVTLVQTPHIVVDSDGPSYLLVAHAILTHHQFLDAIRTPGYPILLALIFSVTGEKNLAAVTNVQAVLVVIAALEIYPLVYLLTRRRWVACVSAVLVGANLYILDWERLVRYETLSFFLLVTLFLALALYVRTERALFLGAVTVVFVAAVLTRPSMVLLPGILLALLTFRSQRLGRLRIQWRSLLLSVVITYGLLGGYMAANEVAFGFFGLSNTSNIDLFSKILEYRMQDESNSPQYARLRAAADQYVRTVSPPGSRGPLEPYVFVYGTPSNHVYGRNGYAILADYSKDIILHHPIQYALDSVPDIFASWNAQPTLYYAHYSATSKWIYQLLDLSGMELLAYLLLPVALALLTVAVWRAPREGGAFMLWVMLITVTANVLLDGFACYIEFYRQRDPFDWMMVVTVGILVIDALALAFEKLRPTLLEQLNGFRNTR